MKALGALALVAIAGAATPWLLLYLAMAADISQTPSLSRLPVFYGVVAVCALAIHLLKNLSVDGAIARTSAIPNRWLAAAALGMIAVEWAVGGGVLQNFYIIDDQYAVAMQAEAFAAGRLYAPAPPAPEAFNHPHYRIVGDIWVSQYPPGLAALLAPFAWAGAPLWLMPGLFAAGCLAIFWRLARRRLDRSGAVLASAAFAGSAFFVLNAAMPFPHIVTAFFGLAAIESALRARTHIAWALLAGLCIGALGIIRPFNALIFMAPTALALCAHGNLKSNLLRLALFGAGGVPFGLALLAYHSAVTGSPFTPVTSWVGVHEPLGAPGLRPIWLTARRAVDLAFTTSPVLSLAAFLAPFVLWRARALKIEDLVFPFTFVAFLFYGGDGGPSYGPRYLFEAYPFIVLSAAVALSHTRLGAAAASVHFAFQLAALPSWLAVESYASWTAREPYRLVAAQGLSNAIVILETGAGAYRHVKPETLARNAFDFRDSPVIFAINAGDDGAALRRAFPDRAFFIYRDGVLSPASPDGGAPPASP